jgi:hypothetical protein
MPMGHLIMAGVLVLMRPMISLMFMILFAGCSPVFMLMRVLVFVFVFMGMLMFMIMAVLLVPMGVRMLVPVNMRVGMPVIVFVLSSHEASFPCLINMPL